MKRINHIYHKICSIANLELADLKARKGKLTQPGVIAHDKNREGNILKLQDMLLSKTYTTSTYTTFKIYEPKEREIFRLPYFPDRITHHAVMNVMEPIFVSTFTANTYSCIKGRGIKAAADDVKQALRDRENTVYCLKLDIKKFYPSVNHTILKQQLRRKVKDQDALWLLDEIIDSTPGLPIGNYLSQYFANFYLTPFDHWIKETKRRKYFFRYADDIVILARTKQELHELLVEIKAYLWTNLRLEVKGNYQVFPVADRGIDFLGYVFYHTHVRMYKTIKKNFARKVARNPFHQSIPSYTGWGKHGNCKHLIETILYGSKKVQRVGDKGPGNEIYWGKGISKPNPQQGDKSVRLPN